jgi:chromosome segregation ATPase
MRLEMASSSGRVDALEAARQRAERSRHDLAQQLESRHLRRAELDERAAALEGEIADGERHLAELVSARTHAEGDLEAARDSRQQILDQIAANLEEVNTERQQLESDQASLHRSQVRGAQLETEVGFSERTLMDDYRLTVEQALNTKPDIGPRTAAQARLTELHAAIQELGTVNLSRASRSRSPSPASAARTCSCSRAASAR